MNAKPINSQYQKQTQQSFLLLLFERERSKPNTLNDKNSQKATQSKQYSKHFQQTQKLKSNNIVTKWALPSGC